MTGSAFKLLAACELRRLSFFPRIFGSFEAYKCRPSFSEEPITHREERKKNWEKKCEWFLKPLGTVWGKWPEEFEGHSNPSPSVTMTDDIFFCYLPVLFSEGCLQTSLRLRMLFHILCNCGVRLGDQIFASYSLVLWSSLFPTSSQAWTPCLSHHICMYKGVGCREGQGHIGKSHKKYHLPQPLLYLLIPEG